MIWGYSKWFKSILLLVFLIVISHSTIFGELKFKHYNSNDGLNNNTVFSIVQDGEGFMWFGTEKGLARFDGLNFYQYYYRYNSDDGIPGNKIEQLATDYHGDVWILSEGKVAKYSKTKDDFEVFKPIHSSKKDVYVNNLFKLENGDLGFCTNAGIFLFDHKLESFEQPWKLNSNLLTDNIQATIYTEDAGYWIFKKDAIYVLDSLNTISEKHIIVYGDKVPNLTQGLSGIIEGLSGEIFVSKIHSGVYEIDKNDYAVKPLMFSEGQKAISSNVVHCLELDTDGKLWIGTELGINIYNPRDKSLKLYQQDLQDKNALQDNAIYSICKDKQGNMWVGTFFSGVCVNLRYGNSFTHYIAGKSKNTLNGKALSQIVEDNKGNLWIGTEDGGLNYFDVKEQTFRHFSDEGGNSLSYRNVHALTIDKKSRLWIGTYLGGLNILDKGKFRLQSYEQDKPWNLPSNNIYSLCTDTRGKVWVGTMAGISYFDETTGNLVRPGGDANSGWCMSIINGNNNSLWAGMWGRGLFRSSKDNKSFKSVTGYINDSNIPIPENIISLEQTNDNLIWIGTTDNGLYSFDPATNKFKYIDALSTIPDNTIYSIIKENENKLWLTTNKGLVVYDRKKENYRLFTVGDGLPINQFNYKSGYMHSNGTIYLGTVEGMISFRPDKIVENTNIPEVKIVELLMFNKPVRASSKNSVLKTAIYEAKEIILKHNENSLGFRFALIDYTSPKNNSFAYRMKGLEEDWQEVGNQNQANYARIPHGTYTFEVKGCNSDGVWSDDVASIALVIKPPFWLSWWGYLVYFLAFVVVILGYWKYTLIRLAQRTELERAKMEKTKMEELNQLKLKFYTNISHEFRTPLNLIIDPLQKITERKFRDKHLQETTELILRNAKRLQVMVNQLLDFRKTETGQFVLNVEQGDIGECIYNVYIRFKTLAEQQKINFTYTQGSIPGKVWFDKKIIDIILNNLISNAFKFTPEGGEINVTAAMINSGTKYLDIAISDTGVGISKKHVEHIFERFYQVENKESKRKGSGIGLALVESLVKLHHGEVTVKSKLKLGTTFNFQVPVEKLAYTKDELQKSGFEQSKKIVSAEKKQSGLEVEDVITEKQSVKILLVEDNVELRNYIVRELNSVYVAESAENGKFAWEMIKNNPPDIIVSDVMMPEMDGFELCSKVKNEIRTSHIPVILLTAKTGTEDKTDGLEFGADIYIEKPFNSKILFAHIKNLIKLKSNLTKRFATEIGIEVSEITRTTKDENFIRQAIRLTFKNLSNPEFGSNDLVKEMNVSRSLLYLKLKEVTGKSAGDFIQSIRTKEAARLLKSDQLTISEVAYQTGFNDPSYFSRCFKKHFGVSPKEFKTSSLI